MMKKRPFAKSTWFDWLINYIPEPMKKKTVDGVKDKITSLFKTNTTKDCLGVVRNQENQK